MFAVCDKSCDGLFVSSDFNDGGRFCDCDEIVYGYGLVLLVMQEPIL